MSKPVRASPTATERVPAAWYGALVSLTLVAGWLRFRGIGRRDFWLDESNTYLALQWLYERGPEAPHFVQATNLLYYVVLHAWVAMFGESEFAYRSLSALLSLACVPVVAFAAARVLSARAALGAAALAAFHALHLYYGQEARAYAAWTLTLSLATWLGLRAAQRGGWGAWCLYAAAVLAALGTHVMTVFWLPASVAFVWMAPSAPGGDARRRALRGWLGANALAGLVFAPYFVWVCWPVLREGVGAWAASAWDPWLALPSSLWGLLPAGAYPGYLHGLSLLSPSTTPPASMTLALLAAFVPVLVGCAALGVVAASAWGARPQAAASNIRGLALLALGPLASLWAVSFVLEPAYIVGRYDLLAWPGFVLLLTASLDALARAIGAGRERIVFAGFVALLVACAALPILRFTSHPLEAGRGFDYRRAAELAGISKAGDLVLCFEYDADKLAYPLARAGFAGETLSFPSWLDRQIGWVDHALELRPERAALHRADARERAKLVWSALDQGRRVWLLDDSLFVELEAADARAGPQRAINQHLRVALREAGLELRIASPALSIYEVRVAR